MTGGGSRSLDAEVVVIGAGVMGAATAWQLARRGTDVLLVERFTIGHKHGASHGASRNFNVSYEDEQHLAWLREAAGLWRELEAELRGGLRGGLGAGLGAGAGAEPGAAVLATGAEVLTTGAEVLTTTGIVNHGPGRDFARVAAAVSAGGFDTELLDAAEASSRWPGFRFEGLVLHTPQAGRLNADRAVAGFAHAAEARGARVLQETAVIGGTVGDDGVEVRVRNAAGVEGVIRAQRAVVTTGAWTGDILSVLGASFAVSPLSPLLPLSSLPTMATLSSLSSLPTMPTLRVTQEQPAFFAPLGGIEDWPGFNHAPSPDDPATAWFLSGVYGMGSPGEGIKAGWHGVGPVTHPDRRTYEPDPKLSALIQRYAYEWLPGVDAAAMSEITCTYTSTPDAAFFLDRVGPVAVGAGFSGHGFKFAPVVGRILADLVDEAR